MLIVNGLIKSIHKIIQSSRELVSINFIHSFKHSCSPGNFIILCVWVLCVHVCLSTVCMYLQVLLRSEEGIGSLRTGATSGYKSSKSP